jgi:hypothetical protein
MVWGAGGGIGHALVSNLTGAHLAAHYSEPLLVSEAFAEVLAKEERRCRVIVVRPVAVDTPLWTKAPFKLPPSALTPAEAAERILSACRSGQRGVLALQDLPRRGT